jgi:LysM repeat protein
MQKKISRAGPLILVLLIAITFTPTPVLAETSAGDLVSAVNALRAAHALPPYQVDSNLMAFAQEHSEYQASIGTVTHTHIDGSSPEQDNVFENVAEGSDLAAETVIYSLWSDALHQSTMIGIKTGFIGAGVATSNGISYFTIDVRKTEGFTYTPQAVPTGAPAAPGATAAGSLATAPPASTPIPIVPLVTATPHADGMVVHVVGSGQTLFDIALAYKTTVADIQRLNNLASSTEIYPEQKLLIHLADPALAAAAGLTATAAHITPTATRTATRTRRPTVTRTVTPTARPSLAAQNSPAAQIDAGTQPAVSAALFQNNRSIGIGLILFCLVGLGVLGLTVFRRK